jgi:hypothetical protein
MEKGSSTLDNERCQLPMGIFCELGKIYLRIYVFWSFGHSNLVRPSANGLFREPLLHVRQRAFSTRQHIPRKSPSSTRIKSNDRGFVEKFGTLSICKVWHGNVPIWVPEKSMTFILNTSDAHLNNNTFAGWRNHPGMLFEYENVDIESRWANRMHLA